ncbi:MAG TPA: hypothetical protein PK854_12545 [Oscillospiraceae bacterium]|nr:hypothetical protein [Oscillospiraceae bacterium]HPS36080.1 hypothetical protein [Oscillospiraceae bacterium]
MKKLMKRSALVALILMLTAALLLTGCFAKPKTQGIKTSEGEIVVGEQMAWPDADMPGLSKPDATIVSVVRDNASGSCMVIFSDMAADDASNYIAALKQQGFEPVLDMTETDSYLFSGARTDGENVTFSYTISTKEGTVTHTPAQGS